MSIYTRSGRRSADDLRGLVAACAGTLLAGTALQSSLIPLLPRLADENHLSSGQLALVAGAYSVGILVTALPTAALVARFGAKSVLVGAVGLLAASGLMLVAGSGATTLVLSRLLQGVAGCMVWGAAFPWIASVAPRHQQGRLVGLLLSAGVAGGLVGPLIPLAVDAVGHQVTFALLTATIVAVGVACLKQPAPAPHQKSSVGRTAPVRRGRVVLGGWLVAVVGVIVGIGQVMGSLRMDAVGGSTLQIAALLMVTTACQAALNPLVGVAIDRWGTSPPILFGLVAVAAALVCFTFPSGPTAQFAVVVVTLCCSTVVWCPAITLTSSGARDAGMSQGAVFAVINLAWASGTLLGTSTSGALGSTSQQAVATYFLAVIALASTAATVAGLRGTRPRRRTDGVADPALESEVEAQVSQRR